MELKYPSFGAHALHCGLLIEPYGIEIESQKV